MIEDLEKGSQNIVFLDVPYLGLKSCKFCKLGVFWNPQDLLLMMGTEIFKIVHLKLSNSRKTESLISNRAKCRIAGVIKIIYEVCLCVRRIVMRLKESSQIYIKACHYT